MPKVLIGLPPGYRDLAEDERLDAAERTADLGLAARARSAKRYRRPSRSLAVS